MRHQQGVFAGVVALLMCSAVLGARIPASGSIQASDSICDSCLVAIRILDDFLCDPAATEFLMDIIEKNLCPAFGDAEQCDQMTEALLPVAVQWLRASATPASLCSSAGVCGDRFLNNPLMNRPHAKLKDGVECPMCKYIVTEVKLALDNPTTQEEIKEKALQACSVLPADLAQSCSDLVMNYSTLLVAFIDTMDPTYTCELMGLCTEGLMRIKLPVLSPQLVQTVHDVRPKLVQAQLSDNMCDKCKLTVLEIHTLISNPTFQQSMDLYAKTLCNGASLLSEVCKHYVDVYSPVVFNMLMQYVQPDPVCQKIHFCPKPTLLEQFTATLLSKTAGQLTHFMP